MRSRSTARRPAGGLEPLRIEGCLTHSVPQADSALLLKQPILAAKLHRQAHAQSLGSLRTANSFAFFSAYSRCHHSIVDVWLARCACLGTGCREQGQSAGCRRVQGACNAGEQGRRARSPPDRASRRGQTRYGGYSRQELPALRPSGDPRHGIGWADVRRQPLSRADLAGFSGRDADRPPGKRPVGPDDSGLLHSAIHAEG
jgi:hypothetical protein